MPTIIFCIRHLVINIKIIFDVKTGLVFETNALYFLFDFEKYKNLI